MNLQTRKKKS